MMGKKEETDFDTKQILSFFKKRWSLFIVIAILILGFYIRAYHIDYPVIGYHNQKEAHTLSEIRNFYDGGNLLVPERDYYKPHIDKPYGIHGDNFPLVAWIITALWKIFGLSLWTARLVIILFSLMAVLFTYLLVREMFDREDFALLSALFTAIMPLLVFFGRQVQYDTPALGFSMAALYFFWLWKKDPKTKHFVWFCFLFILGGVSKYPFLIFIVPVLAAFPYKRLNIRKKEFKKKYLRQFLIGGSSVIIFLFWWFFSTTLNLKAGGSTLTPFVWENLG